MTEDLWAAWHHDHPLISLTPQGVVFSVLSTAKNANHLIGCRSCAPACLSEPPAGEQQVQTPAVALSKELLQLTLEMLLQVLPFSPPASCAI